MAYTKQTFTSGQTLKASDLNTMSQGIFDAYELANQGAGGADARVDELYTVVNGGEPISITDLSVYEQVIGLPNQPTAAAHWVIKDTYKHIVVPVPETGCKLKFTTNASTALMYCGLKSYEKPTSANSELVYSDDAAWNMRWSIQPNNTVEKNIPDDVNYILLVVVSNEADAYPASFEIGKEVSAGLAEEVKRLSGSLKPLMGKTLFAFGDSITYGYITIDGVRQDVRYTEKIKEKLGCNIENYGSSGAATGRLCTIVTGGVVDRKSDVDPSSPTLCTDYTKADVVTIMIGTNSGISVAGVPSTKADIPQINGATVKTIADGGTIEYNGQTISTTEGYWALFPNSFHGNVSLCIEWIQWKAPNAKIYLITPPRNNIGDWRDFVYSEVRPALYEIAHHYGIEVIDAQVNCGISMHNLLDYTFDGTHFNQEGCAKWGYYIASQMK